MAGVSVQEGGKKRSTNSEINMIPFIDLLMVTIAFLLITAVWVTNSRINADAQVPGPPNPTEQVEPTTPERILHLYVNEDDFTLTWKQGAQVISENKVAKPKTDANADVVRYTELSKKLGEEWARPDGGNHRDPSDRKLDQAVLHTDNKTPFKEVVGVLDALYATKRDIKLQDGTSKSFSVFNMTFSVN